eukprot:NODE_156_length_16689_cov_0.273960.p10 type:complete len:129 gc:universal NODE_156_length_16689_cov_0.273960:5659-5273(-)
MAKALLKQSKQKRSKQFKRHHSDRYDRVKTSWRKPNGIDSCVRRRFKGCIPMPSIGYGTHNKHLLPNGLYKVWVENEADVQKYLMDPLTYAIEIKAKVSQRKKRLIVDKCAQYGLYVTNPSVATVDKE